MNRIEFLHNLSKYKGENNDVFLSHYGIIGQKWGTRRWQNPDGTFNTEGKIRYFGSQKAQAEKMQNNKVGGYWARGSYYLGDKDPDDDSSWVMSKNYYKNSTRSMYDNEIEARLNYLRNNRQRNDPEYDYELKTLEDEARSRGLRYGSQNDKVGLSPVTAIVAAVMAKSNYDNTNYLRDRYSKVMDEDGDFSKEERLAVLNNKKKIAKAIYALESGKDEKYEKILKKFKTEEEREAARKLIAKLYKKSIEQEVPEDTQKALDKTLEDNKLGSISKPHVKKKYLNEDGTLNNEGKRKLRNKSKKAEIASSVFFALRNLNIYDAIVTGPAMFALTLSGFGVPAALAMGLATTAVSAGAAGIDNSLYKKLEKRADAYYEMMK